VSGAAAWGAPEEGHRCARSAHMRRSIGSRRVAALRRLEECLLHVPGRSRAAAHTARVRRPDGRRAPLGPLRTDT
jgi:hypothetical protein